MVHGGGQTETFWEFQSSFLVVFVVLTWLAESEHIYHLLLSPEGFWLVGITWGKGCFTISNICKVWLMSEWVNPPWHHWMCSAAFHLSDEVTPRSPTAWQSLFFLLLICSLLILSADFTFVLLSPLLLSLINQILEAMNLFHHPGLNATLVVKHDN